MASTTFAMSYRKLRAIYAAKKRRRSVSLQNSEEYDSVSIRWKGAPVKIEGWA